MKTRKSFGDSIMAIVMYRLYRKEKQGMVNEAGSCHLPTELSKDVGRSLITFRHCEYEFLNRILWSFISRPAGPMARRLTTNQEIAGLEAPPKM